MKELKGTKTEKNLQEAFAGESMARNKYSYWASKAKKDGYVQIAAIFEETANNEKEHAKLWFKLLEGGAIKSTTEKLLPTVRTSSGPTCMPAWLRRLVRRDSTRLPRSLKAWPRSRRSTRSATASCSTTSIRNAYSQRTATSSGSALTVVISWLARRHLRSAPSAITHRLTSR